MAIRSNSGHFPSGFSFGNSDKMASQSRVKEAEIVAELSRAKRVAEHHG